MLHDNIFILHFSIMIIRTQMKHWPLVHIIHHLEDPNGTSHSTWLLTYRSGCIRAGDFQVMDWKKNPAPDGRRYASPVCKPVYFEPRPPMRSLRDPEPLKDIGGKMLISKLQPPQSWI